jgi:hypothetical protein
MITNQHPYKLSDFSFMKTDTTSQGFTNVVVYNKKDDIVHRFATDNPTKSNIKNIIKKWMDTLFVNIDAPKSGTKITIVCGTSKICDKVKTSLRSIVDEFYIVTGSTRTAVEFDGFDGEQCVDAQETLRLELLNLGLTEGQFKIIVS